MRWQRKLALWAITGLAVASLTGCAPAVCAGPEEFPPGVWLDPSPWLAAHPASTLTVCLDGNCKTADAHVRTVLQLILPGHAHPPAAGNSTYVVSVTSHGPADLTIRTRVALYESRVTGACGTVTWWQTDARLNAGGRLSVWHGSPGPFPLGVPPSSTPGDSRP